MKMCGVVIVILVNKKEQLLLGNHNLTFRKLCVSNYQ